MEIGGELLRDRVRCDPGSDLHSGLSKPSHALTGHPGIRVLDADQHAGHPGGDNGIDARRCPTVMGARFESDHEGAAPRSLTGCLKGDNFGVAPADWLGGAVSDDDPVLAEHHGPDPRIWACGHPGTLGGRDRHLHEMTGICRSRKGVERGCRVVHGRKCAHGDTPTGTVGTVLLDLLPSGL